MMSKVGSRFLDRFRPCAEALLSITFAPSHLNLIFCCRLGFAIFKKLKAKAESGFLDVGMAYYQA